MLLLPEGKTDKAWGTYNKCGVLLETGELQERNVFAYFLSFKGLTIIQNKWIMSKELKCIINNAWYEIF
jgi:hypothetical protein